ncbi:MAG TPA: vWA domain-containing protein, partial [Acidimicrobiia bacterium]
MLFVHGHNPNDASDADFNYRKDWVQAVDGLPSFQLTLEDPANAGTLDIEAYFIRFVDQHRSIVDDARDIGDAVERILARHDPSYTPFMANPSTPVKVAIIAFSKGTISARLYLKSLQTQQFDLPAPRAGFNPISEFVALSPPNHGTAVSALLALNLAVRQLNNGFSDTCQAFGVGQTGHNFIQDLNGHPITDSQSAPLGSFDTEAPLSRHPTDDPVGAGTLYVTVFADGNRDAVGGGTPSNDCQGRLLARNLAPHARNIQVPEIPDMPRITIGFGVDPIPLSVHRNTPHTPAVICLALVTVVHQKAPADDFRCATAGAVPRIPPRAAVVQVLDISGSMLDPACPNCARKIDVLKDSAELFIQLWGVLSGAGDRIGATYFGSQVDSFTTGNQQVVDVSAASLTALIGDLTQRAAVAANRTAMGGGIQRAIEALETVDVVAIPQRHVIVFTDGMQN